MSGPRWLGGLIVVIGVLAAAAPGVAQQQDAGARLELLGGPYLVEEGDVRLGALTVFRRAFPGSPRLQTIMVELIDVAQNPARPPGRIDAGDVPLEGGSFSLTLPENGVEVLYSQVETFRLRGGRGEQVGRRVLSPFATVSGHAPSAYRIFSGAWEPYGPQDREIARAKRQGLELIGGSLPGLGQLYSMYSYLDQFAFDQDSVPIVSVGNGAPEYRPNRQDQVVQSWKGGTRAAVFMFPLNLERQTIEVQMRGSWSVRNVDALGQLKESYTIRADVPESDAGEPPEVEVPSTVEGIVGERWVADTTLKGVEVELEFLPHSRSEGRTAIRFGGPALEQTHEVIIPIRIDRLEALGKQSVVLETRPEPSFDLKAALAGIPSPLAELARRFARGREGPTIVRYRIDALDLLQPARGVSSPPLPSGYEEGLDSSSWQRSPFVYERRD